MSLVIVVVPLTTFRGQRLYPSEVRIVAKLSGLRADSVALFLQVGAISRERIGGRLRGLDPGTLVLIEDALLLTLDIQR